MFHLRLFVRKVSRGPPKDPVSECQHVVYGDTASKDIRFSKMLKEVCKNNENTEYRKLYKRLHKSIFGITNRHYPSRVQLKKNMMKIVFHSVFALVLLALSISEGRHHVISWPSGQYCLPMPDNHKCPFGWAKGYRFHDAEDRNNANQRSGHVPFLSHFGRNIEWGFCCKTCTTTDNCYQPYVVWPEGQYCIFRKGGLCPTGFNEGGIFWDDEDDDNQNRVSGTLPDGTYGRNTKIYFCCRDDGGHQTLTGQSLPTCNGLVLMRYQNSCPTVPGYRGPYTGYLEWDNEDSRNEDEKNGAYPDGIKSSSLGSGIKIEFCTYKSSGIC